MSVCDGSGKFGGWDYTQQYSNDVTFELIPTLYCVHVCDIKRMHSRSSSWSGCSWGAAAEADAIGEHFSLTTRD